MQPPESDSFGSAATLVSRERLEGRVDSFLLNRMERGRHGFVVREITPRLTWNRLDLAIKLYYLEQAGTGASSFAEELYDAHIHAFSLGDFREPGNDDKTNAASFRSAFLDILENMRNKGFDPGKSLIPVASDGSFINGGHRTACAMFLRRKVHIVETGLPPVRYDHRYFRSRGMDDDLIEASVLRYMERSPRSRLILVRPGADGTAKSDSSLGSQVYRKALRLSAKGASNLFAALGWHPTSGATDLWGERRLLVEVIDVEEASCDVDQRPAHSAVSDHIYRVRSHEHSLSLARVLLNERSVHALNAACPDRFVETSGRTSRFRDTLIQAGVSLERAALGPSMLLATFGSKEAQAADFRSPVPLPEQPGLLRLPSGPDIHEVLEDPRRHLHYGGLKFLSVEEAIRVLKRDPQPGASEDLRLLSSLRPGTGWTKVRRGFVAKSRLYHSRIRRSVIHAVARLGLRDQAKAAYRALRRPG